MNRLSFTIVLLLIINLLYGQNATNEAIVSWHHNGTIKILDAPSGSEITTIKNDSLNENFISLEILEEKKGYFHVQIWLAIDQVKHQGWIKKQENIGAFLRNQNEFVDIKLYLESHSDEFQLIEKWKTKFITIEEYDQDWIKISISHKGKRLTGWIKSNLICANNYSTCS